jgi:hypothetical protein
MLAALLAVVAFAASGPADDCPRIEVNSTFGPEDRLMPENETYEATVSYIQPWTDTETDCGPVPACGDPTATIWFGVERKPDYATAWFEPESVEPQQNVSAKRQEATTRLFVKVNGSAPAFETGHYVVRGAGRCGPPQATAELWIKNDYAAQTAVTPSSSRLTASSEASDLPAPPAATLAFLILGSVLLLGRKKPRL